MSKKPSKKEALINDSNKRSEIELLDEEAKNQRTIDIYLDTEKNWC